MFLAASFFAYSQSWSQYVKQSKHLLDTAWKEKKNKKTTAKQMHTYSSFLTFAPFVSLHHNATLNMVRTSFLKLMKAVKCIVRCLTKSPIRAKTWHILAAPAPQKAALLFPQLLKRIFWCLHVWKGDVLLMCASTNGSAATQNKQEFSSSGSY